MATEATEKGKRACGERHVHKIWRGRWLFEQHFVVDKGVTTIDNPTALRESAFRIKVAGTRRRIVGVQAYGVRGTPGDGDPIIHRELAESLVLMRDRDGNPSEVNRPLRRSEIANVDCPRLFLLPAAGR